MNILLPGVGWPVCQVLQEGAEQSLFWIGCAHILMFLNILEFLMLCFISLQFSSDNNKQFLISFLLWCVILQIFIHVFPVFFVVNLGYLSLVLQSNQFFYSEFSSKHDIWRFLESGSQTGIRKWKPLGKWPWALWLWTVRSSWLNSTLCHFSRSEPKFKFFCSFHCRKEQNYGT